MSIFTTPVRLDRPLAATGIEGNLLYVGRRVQAWFVLGEAPWLFRSVAEREVAIHAIANGFAAAAGCEIHLRVASVPRNGNAWAKHFDSQDYSPDVLPDVPGSGRTWVARVHADRDEVARYSERLVMLGVTLGRARQGKPLPSDVAETLSEVTTALAEPALGARPASASDLAWLITHSTAMGLAPPLSRPWITGMEADDMVALNAESIWSGLVTGRTVQVTAANEGNEETAHVAVLTLGRMERMRFPENGRAPWLQYAEHFDFDVEVSVHGRVIGGPEGISRAETVVGTLLGIKDHYVKDHHETPPIAVERNLAHAEAILDRVTEGTKAEAASCECVVRFAVSAPTQDEAIRRASIVAKRYGDVQHMWPSHTRGQADALAEFVPGEPWDDSGYLRGLPLPLFAAGVPHAQVSVGTPVGPILGETIGSTRARPTIVLHDGHYPMEKLDQSGFVPFVANLGAGKSVAMGSIAAERASRGINTAVFDASPQGPLSRLCRLPELAPFSRHIPLSAAAPGQLNTYRLVPEPQRGAFDTEATWRDACAIANGERRELTLDAMLGCLPHSTAHRDGTEDILRLAVTRAPCHATASPWGVLDALERMDGWAGQPQILAELLTAAATSSAMFMFPPRGAPIADLGESRVVLTVITTGNLNPPRPGSNPSDWTPRERTAILKLNLAAHLTTTFAYEGDPSAPKTAIIDEVRFLGFWESGKSLVSKLGYDFRKYNGEAIAGGQDPEHLADLGIAAFMGGMFMGRQTDSGVAARMLEMAGIATGVGYESDITSLRTGEFIYLDCFRRMSKIRIKIRDERLLAHLDTTPGRSSLELAR